MGEVSLTEEVKYERTPFGKDMLKHFAFDPAWKNLNHGIIALMLILLFQNFDSFVQARSVQLLELFEISNERTKMNVMLDLISLFATGILNCWMSPEQLWPNS